MNLPYTEALDLSLKTTALSLDRELTCVTCVLASKLNFISICRIYLAIIAHQSLCSGVDLASLSEGLLSSPDAISTNRMKYYEFGKASGAYVTISKRPIINLCSSYYLHL